jgi:Protein-tyrosine-phosphatase
VCLGNICRSSAAQEILQTYLNKKGVINQFKVDSAGLINYHKGELPDKRMRDHASKRGYILTHLSRPIAKDDIKNFSYIIAMDRSIYNSVKEMVENPEDYKKIFLMQDFSLNYRDEKDVPDPYYGGSEGFEHVLDMLEDSCEVFSDILIKNL